MTEQRANSGSPLAGTAPANNVPANAAPPIPAPTSDAAADAAAWARIDRALKSTRKWLWVILVFGCLFSAMISIVAIGAAVSWPAIDDSTRVSRKMPMRQIILELLLLTFLALWAISAAASAFGMLHWVIASRRQGRVIDYGTLLAALEPQPFAWSASAIAFGVTVAYLGLVLVLIVSEV